MAFLGSLGKVIGGAATGFLISGGNPLGALVGGVAGALSRSGGNPLGAVVGGELSGSGGNQVGVVIPPTVQEAYNIIKGLEGQVGNVASSQYNIMKPYLDEALSIFRGFPNTLNQLFDNTENAIANRYASLFDNIQTQMKNQWSKSALGLSALGMYNTPATQLTQSDIVDKLFERIAEEKMQALNQLDVNKMSSLVDYYSNAPKLLATFGETFANINPDMNKYQLQLQLAGVLNGLNTAIYPKTSPLAQTGQMINSVLLNNVKNLPSWDSVKSGLSSIVSAIGGIFGGGGSSFSFSAPTPSYGWSSACFNSS